MGGNVPTKNTKHFEWGRLTRKVRVKKALRHKAMWNESLLFTFLSNISFRLRKFFQMLSSQGEVLSVMYMCSTLILLLFSKRFSHKRSSDHFF